VSHAGAGAVRRAAPFGRRFREHAAPGATGVRPRPNWRPAGRLKSAGVAGSNPVGRVCTSSPNPERPRAAAGRLEKLENTTRPVRLFSLNRPRQFDARARRKLSLALYLALTWGCLWPNSDWAQTPGRSSGAATNRVLLIFSEARDLPGNVMMEQAARGAMLANTTNRIEFFSESMDASRFSTPQHDQLFQAYIRENYGAHNLDLIVMFMGRSFLLAQELAAPGMPPVPALAVVVNDLELPDLPGGRKFAGLVQRFDVRGTVEFILQLQPQTRRVVVVGGTAPADQAVLASIADTARSVEGVRFDYWTNRPLNEVYQAATLLPQDTVILLGTVLRDAAGEPSYTTHVVQTLAPLASVPVYVLGNSLIGSGAVGGTVVDFENLGASVGKLASRLLAGTPISRISLQVRSNGIPMADWRALQRWHIESRRLPANCVVLYRPHSLWEEHGYLFLAIGLGFLAQAVTIAALLIQRRRNREAEAEILRQRTELAHASRVSMMGQLASALTHELNQPLGAILRNAEAAEVYLQSERPDLKEVQAILADIRRDDKRAGDVIDRMRSLFKRQKLVLANLDMRDLLEDTIAMVRPDAAARQIHLKVVVPPDLPAAQGDRVHVQQVLFNLIFNAMDALVGVPDPRRSLTVEAAGTKHGNVQISVRDCGAGIAPEHAARIFEPFFTTKSNGMGMGLAISKTIVEAHGGEIWMRSCAMEGTTFTFLLPPAGGDKVRPGDLPPSLQAN